MKHIAVMTTVPARAQSPVQVKLDFTTDLSTYFATTLPSVFDLVFTLGVGFIQNTIGFGGIIDIIIGDISGGGN
ncbi:MAG: hypothetical protein K1Y02_12035 [Candidatus Hydrogenedentes bacterium]|nr:hypothetical protein [Candidatus Hydrogenedentota bacterium]